MSTKSVIHFYKPINPETVSAFCNITLNAIFNGKATELTILISSEGGDICSGFTAYSFIRTLPTPVTAINMGSVESMAVPFYLAADSRLAVKHARFMLHSFHWGFPAGTVDHPRLAEHTESLFFDRTRYANIFNERTNACQRGFDITEHLNNGFKILDTHEAVQIGITTSESFPKDIISTEDLHFWL